MSTQRDLLTTWLSDAHAMETSSLEMFERHEKNAEGHPELQAMYREFHSMGERKRDELRTILEGMDDGPSKLKDTGAKIAGMVEGMMNRPAGDTVVKDLLMEAGGARFAMASYRALERSAKRVGELEVAALCERVLTDLEACERRIDDALVVAVDAELSERDVAA